MGQDRKWVEGSLEGRLPGGESTRNHLVNDHGVRAPCILKDCQDLDAAVDSSFQILQLREEGLPLREESALAPLSVLDNPTSQAREGDGSWGPFPSGGSEAPTGLRAGAIYGDRAGQENPWNLECQEETVS